MVNKFSIFLVFVLFIATNGVGQIAKYSNDYLTIGVSAKNISLSNSVVANVSDYSSSYYNPAGLSGLDSKYQAALMHSEYFAGIAKYDYASFSYKLSDSTGLGVSIIRLGIDNIKNTLYLIDENGNIDYDKIELFSVADYALFLSFGKKSKVKGLSYGINTKLIFRSQGKFASAYGFGIDVGAKYVLKKWNFGANLMNATTSFTAWFNKVDEQMKIVFEQTNNKLPTNNLELTMPMLQLGSGRYFKFSDATGLNCELDILFTFDGERNALVSFNPVSIYPQAGLEFDFKKIVFLRGGIGNMQLIPDFVGKKDSPNVHLKDKSFDFVPSLGIGLVFHGFYLDYAFTDVANQSIALYSHIFSVSYKF